MIETTKIFTKLFLSYIFIIFLSFMMFGVVLIYLFHINLYSSYEENYVHYHHQVEKHFQAREMFNWKNEEASVTIEPYLNHKDFSIFIYDMNGKLLYSPDNYMVRGISIDMELIGEAFGEELVTKGGMEEGSLTYSIASSIQINESSGDSGVMLMVWHDLSHEYYQMIIRILLTFTITIAFAGVIIWYISRKITDPLRRMNAIALNYARGDFSQYVEISSKDEIGQLGETFNFMANELNRLEETRKDFIANLSHDLRSPLTSIKGFLIAMLDGTIPYKDRNHYYLLMKDETERVIKLVNDTLDMTQLEAGQIQLKKSAYSFTKQMQMIAAKLEPQLGNKNINISIISDNREIMVFADRERMEQAIINLLENAIQFSHHGGEIKIFIEKQIDQALISIQDNGKGIDEEQLQHIWKRFYKVDKARTSKSGVGIGLSIVKSIMDMHNASISVESKPREGTRFTFKLPLSDKN